MRISECLGINLRTVQKIWKELDEFNSNYKITAAQKPHSDLKGTSEFVGETQAIIHEDPSKSIKSKVRDMEVYEFLIRLIVHEDIWYFSYKMRKSQFLS